MNDCDIIRKVFGIPTGSEVNYPDLLQCIKLTRQDEREKLRSENAELKKQQEMLVSGKGTRLNQMTSIGALIKENAELKSRILGLEENVRVKSLLLGEWEARWEKLKTYFSSDEFVWSQEVIDKMNELESGGEVPAGLNGDKPRDVTKHKFTREPLGTPKPDKKTEEEAKG